jgi:hypothetical protein
MMGTCLMTLGQTVAVGPFHFSVLRLLIAVGAARVLLRSEHLPGGWRAVDGLFLAWAGWMCMSSAFHKEPLNDLTSKLGLAYDGCGLFFLFRVFCQGADDVRRIARFTVLLLIPVAVSMLYEHAAFRNLFAVLGGVPEVPTVRDGKIRACGPFLTPILAGTVGAITIVMMASIWKDYRWTAILGGAVGLTMVVASNSSGPLMSVMLGLFAVWCWRFRESMRVLRWGAVLGYIVLDVVMKDPAYFIMARIDLTGSSAGWHRAELIRSAFAHLGEWWLAGTDFTRHWMPTGVSWSPEHTDITNHYLHMGVIGGLPLMLLFMAILTTAFFFVGQGMRRSRDEAFLFWTLGSVLFCHAVTFLSVRYFDQSVLFLYLTLACVTSLAPVQTAVHAPLPREVSRAALRRSLKKVPIPQKGSGFGRSRSLAGRDADSLQAGPVAPGGHSRQSRLWSLAQRRR